MISLYSHPLNTTKALPCYLHQHLLHRGNTNPIIPYCSPPPIGSYPTDTSSLSSLQVSSKRGTLPPSSPLGKIFTERSPGGTSKLHLHENKSFLCISRGRCLGIEGHSFPSFYFDWFGTISRRWRASWAYVVERSGTWLLHFGDCNLLPPVMTMFDVTRANIIGGDP